MKRTVLLFTLLYLLTGTGITQNEFITTWNTESEGDPGSTSITIPTNSDYTYSYDVDWDNDGTFDELGITGNATHDFGSVGIYTIKIQGTFPAIYFNGGGDCEKLHSIDQWGTIAWESMERAFKGCSNMTYKAPDTPDLTNVNSLESTFYNCSQFNGDVSGWDVSTITSLSETFRGASSFNQDLSNWDVGKVESLNCIFQAATSFNQDISTWDVSRVTNMYGVFYNSNAFNQDLTEWDVSNVTNMMYMFYQADAFNGDISKWDVSKVTEMSYMFNSTQNFNSDITNWNVVSADRMLGMFRQSGAFDQDLSNWDISNATNLSRMFESSVLSDENYDNILKGWGAQTVQTSVPLGAQGNSYCHGSAYHDTLTQVYGWIIEDLGESCDSSNYFVTTWKTDNPGTSGNTEITIPTHPDYTYNYEVDWDNDGIFDTTGVTGNVTHDFGTTGSYTIRIRGAFPLIYFNNKGDRRKIVEVNQWGSQAWHSFASAFAGCYSLVIAAEDTPNLSGVTDMSLAFMASDISTSDLSNWDVGNVRDMSGMFMSARVPLGISEWNVGMVTDMSNMFSSAYPINQSLSNWDVGKVTNFENMFIDTDDAFGDISNWDVSSGEDFSGMFESASLFDQDLGNWNISNATDLRWMFNYSSLSNSNYDKILKSWASQVVKDNLSLGAFNINFCQSEYYRDVLKNAYGWTITDGGQACNDTDYFITTWKTDNPGTSVNTEITIPINNSYTYSYDVDWDNDGIFDTLGVSGSITHNYGAIDSVAIAIRGEYPAPNFNASGDYLKLLSIEQWGSIVWKDMSNAFQGCDSAALNATDKPDLSQVTSMRAMFDDFGEINADLSNWNVSTINDFGKTFSATSFTGDISNWDVGKATKMDAMFSNSLFNGDLSNWDVGNVTDFSQLFQNNEEFNQDISFWNTSSAIDMNSMFSGASSFNQDISNWPVGQVTDMMQLFQNALAFNQNIGNWDITGISHVMYMYKMLEATNLSTANYDAILGGWAAQSVPSGINLGTVSAGYCNSETDRETLISTYGWSISDDGQTCADTDCFITTWNTDNEGVSNDSTIIIPIHSSYKYAYDVDWNNDGVFDTLGVTGDYEHTFESPGTYTIRIKGTFPTIYFNNEGDKEKLIAVEQWGLIPWQSMESSFKGCANMNILATDAPDLSRVTSMYECFQYCVSLSANLNHWNVSTITNMYELFEGDAAFNGNISSWNVSSVINMGDMFEGASSFNQDLNSWDVSSVERMSDMFKDAGDFNGNISDWDVSKVMYLDDMFNGAGAFNQDIGGWDLSSVFIMSYMFKDAVSFNQDLNNWDISNTILISNLFDGASAFNSDLDNWNVAGIIEMDDLFRGAATFNGNISKWDVSNVKNMNEMFSGATSFNQDLSSWDVGSVTNMEYMFYGAESFNRDLGRWDMENVANVDSMFYNSGLSIDYYDKLLIGWAEQSLQSNLKFNAGNSQYCNGATARDSIIDKFNWSITDGGLETIAPVPNQQTLPDVIATCEVTQLFAPRATDNCSDTVFVSHDATLPINKPGTTVVTWTFKDRNGNTKTQTQNVILKDGTSPEFKCIENKEIVVIGDVYTVKGIEFDPVSTRDNCAIATIINDVNNSGTLSGVKLPLGKNTITWTITDHTGNTRSCTFTVAVSNSSGLKPHLFGNIGLYPNPAKDHIFINGLNDNAGSVIITIYNTKGSMVCSKNVVGSGRVNLSAFEAGMYFVHISHSDQIETLKLIIE